MELVPLLTGVATALFAFAGNVRGWIVRHGEDPALHSARADRIGLVLLAPVAVYAGYFGAGTSIMLLAILSLGPPSNFRTVNALKNLLSGLSGVVADLHLHRRGDGRLAADAGDGDGRAAGRLRRRATRPRSAGSGRALDRDRRRRDRDRGQRPHYWWGA